MLSPTAEALQVTYMMLVASALAFWMGVFWERENHERRENDAGELEDTPGPDPPPGDPDSDTHT